MTTCVCFSLTLTHTHKMKLSAADRQFSQYKNISLNHREVHNFTLGPYLLASEATQRWTSLIKSSSPEQTKTGNNVSVGKREGEPYKIVTKAILGSVHIPNNIHVGPERWWEIRIRRQCHPTGHGALKQTGVQPSNPGSNEHTEYTCSPWSVICLVLYTFSVFPIQCSEQNQNDPWIMSASLMSPHIWGSLFWLAQSVESGIHLLCQFKWSKQACPADSET